MITHQSICNQLYWRQSSFPLNADDRVFQTFSFSFDPSVWQIFWPVCFGAQLVLAKPGGHQDSKYLVQTIIQKQITVLCLVPSMFRLLLEEKGIENCRGLKHVTCGGEALPVELIERFFECLNLDNVLHNAYGPTEAAIDATYWVCQRGTNYHIAPIGRPIANAQTYILDEELQPVPVRGSGELHIGGDGLAKGYLNRPDLTAQKFIPNPFSDRPDAKLYKTGDLASYLPNGNIKFLGRRDHQVKIRGFRIELGEIELLLSQHPVIEQCVVIDREDVPCRKHLVAYFVSNQELVPTLRKLRCFLKEKLADYMIPDAFVRLEKLPLNSNGKIDRHALPAPDQFRQEAEEIFIAPQNELELQLTKIWEKVLSKKTIGVHDNFFEQGGDSLLATQVVSRLRQAFQVELPLSLLFKLPTVAELAERVKTLQSDFVDVRLGDDEEIEL
jgi:acyl-coenzyme A synthetase/AMP-(fatty) acid ligase/acyl carrier protein